MTWVGVGMVTPHRLTQGQYARLCDSRIHRQPPHHVIVTDNHEFLGNESSNTVGKRT